MLILEFVIDTASMTGQFLDTTYVGKAAYGLSQLMQNKPEVFKGKDVLFLHSGGLTHIYIIRPTLLFKSLKYIFLN